MIAYQVLFSHWIYIVVLWVTSDTLTYVEPIQSIIEYRKEGIQRALAGGDIQSACANTLLVTIDQLWSGAPLTQVKEGLASAQQVSQWNA